MKKKIVMTIMIALLAMTACTNKKELSLYADESSVATVETKESTGETQEALTTKATPAPAVDPDDVIKYNREVYGLNGTDETTESTESGSGETETSSEEGSGEASSEVQPSSSETDSSTESTATSTPAPKETAKPKETTKPVETAKPVETTQPTQTSEPAQTSQPAQTTQPVQTTQPDQTSEPAQTSQPAELTPLEKKAACEANGGHDWNDPYVWRAATCTVPGDLCYICKKCGWERHESAGKAPHDYEATLLREGNCVEPDKWRYVCKNCGSWYEEEDYSHCAERHVWVTGTYKKFDEELLEWVEVSRTCCGICNMDKPE
jgi:predicted RNA-binding Zn-ribbon protein involved in translation (DUF1610 family)